MKKIFFAVFCVACSSLPLTRSDLIKSTSLPLKKQLRPFTSDGCSCWPEGTSTNPALWIHCCFYHDIAYWIGGSSKARKRADRKFKLCIKKEHQQAAELMYLGVRQFGSPRFHSDYRWGYGWNYNRGYIKLTQREKDFAQQFLPKENEKLAKYIDFKKVDITKLDLYIPRKFNLKTYDP